MIPVDISIKIADLSSHAFIDLVNSHNALMLEHSPPESSHALLIDGLKASNIFVWSMFDFNTLVGCGALKILPPLNGEIKAMHTISSRRGEGLGRRMLRHLIEEARKREMRAVSVETGSHPGFLPARKLYEATGFHYCGPFGDYKADPNSVFMSLKIGDGCQMFQTTSGLGTIREPK